MGFKYTPDTQKEIERLYREAGFHVRYERGNFNAGYCILERRKVVVINKFFGLEARINALVDILGRIEVDPAELGSNARALAGRLGVRFAESVEVGGRAEVANPRSPGRKLHRGEGDGHGAKAEDGAQEHEPESTGGEDSGESEPA